MHSRRIAEGARLQACTGCASRRMAWAARSAMPRPSALQRTVLIGWVCMLSRGSSSCSHADVWLTMCARGCVALTMCALTAVACTLVAVLGCGLAVALLPVSRVFRLCVLMDEYMRVRRVGGTRTNMKQSPRARPQLRSGSSSKRWSALTSLTPLRTEDGKGTNGYITLSSS